MASLATTSYEGKAMATLVIDPGHGGHQNIDGSDSNHAESPSGMLEKNFTLDLARRLRWSLTQGSSKAYADSQGKVLHVFMTREGDTNLGLSARADVAAQHDADLFLSLHCNGWPDNAHRKIRGTEAYIDRKYVRPKFIVSAGRTVAQEGPGDPTSGVRNINVAADAQFAGAMAKAFVDALKEHDPGAKFRSARYTAAQNGEAFVPPEGVKMLGLGVLRDAKLGTHSNACRACLLETEFIDHPVVDSILNGGNAVDVRNAIASALGRAIVDAI